MTFPIKYWREAKNHHKYLGKKGKIISFTRISAGPAGFEKQTPYWAGIIELENGERVAGQIKVRDQESEIKIGAKVIGVLRKMGDVGEESVVEYGIKWKIT